jgi:hypothetical protein
MNKHNGYTPIQRAMLQVLSDGRPHPREELHDCCRPSSMGAANAHICFLRKRLAQRSESILCVLKGRSIFYQHVRLLVSPYSLDS